MQTLERAEKILGCFSLNKPLWGLNELSQQVGIPKPSVYRICEALVEIGFLRKNPDKTYSLGLRLLELGSVVLSTLEVRKLAMEEIEKLQNLTGESIHLGILDGTEIVSIEALESSHSLRTRVYIGKRASLYCTAVGKALLAFLPKEQRDEIIEKLDLKPHTKNTITNKKELLKELERIRQRGYAVDNMEDEEGVKCVGAPILNSKRIAIASISISGPSMRITDEKIREYSKMVKEVARNISSKLGYFH